MHKVNSGKTIMETESVRQHKSESRSSLGVSIVTVSDTRTLENDQGGALIVELLIHGGHQIIERRIVIDDAKVIQDCVRELLGDSSCHAVLLTGGTGLAKRDVTTEAVESLYDATIPGYGELFRMLSYQEIGPASMLSRASGGRVQGKILLTMPGSPAGVRLAMEKLVLPELSHMVHHAAK